MMKRLPSLWKWGRWYWRDLCEAFKTFAKRHLAGLNTEREGGGTFPVAPSVCCCIWRAYAVIPCVSSTSLRESNGCVIRLWTICVVSAHRRFRHVRCIASSADPKTLSSHCLMKFTSSKADLFSNQREHLLQRRNSGVMKKPSPSALTLCWSRASVQTIVDATRHLHVFTRLIPAVDHQRSGFGEALLVYRCSREESRLFPTSISESRRTLVTQEPSMQQNLVWAQWSVALRSCLWVPGCSLCRNPADV